MNVPLRLFTILFVLAACSNPHMGAAQAPVSVRLAILLDGDSESSRRVQNEFQREVREFFGGNAEIRFDAVYTGDWSVSSIREAVDRALNDRSVDILVALGPVSSQELCRHKELKKPAIAGVVFDADWQGLPRKQGTSGVRNLTYLNASFSALRSVEEFRKCVPFRSLGVLITEGILESIPRLREQAAHREKELGIEVAYAEAGSSGVAALQKLPAGVDAVYVTPLIQLSSSAFDSLVAACIERKLPTLSYQGRRDVEKGILCAYAPSDDLTRRCRRIASNIQRIAGGEDAGTLPVDFSSQPYLTINMATARAIGYNPPWRALTEAELLNQEDIAAARTVSLASSAKDAISSNLTLMAAWKSVESGMQEVRKARAPLLPQINARATGTLVRKEVAEGSFSLQPQRQLDGTLGVSQLLYADAAWANYSIESSLQSGRESDEKTTELDITLQATTVYLNVLRAKALSRIQRSNLKLTLSNLELARVRQTVGSSSMSDVYRWESEVATTRKNVLDADAQVKLAEIELNRMVNRPLDEPFKTVETSVNDPSLLSGEKRLFQYVENPQVFQVFTRFMVSEGARVSPELQQLTSLIEAQDRAHTAASRSFWLPTFSLQGALMDVFAKGGAGSTPVQLPPPAQMSFGQPDFRWQVEVQASLPIFTGLGRAATLEQTNIELDRLKILYRAAEQSISERVLASLRLAAASYAGIEQANDAAAAAAKNLELVQEAYSQGAVPIVTLIDAQNAALTANEGASNAVYNFLTDLMNVERSIGQFDFLRSPADQAAFWGRLEQFFSRSGFPIRR